MNTTPVEDISPVAVENAIRECANRIANGVLHWAPHHDAGLRERMACLAQWVAENSPAAAVVDVSVEVATLLRLLGVPVIVVAMPGHRVDSPHQMVYQLADHIVAPWPLVLHGTGGSALRLDMVADCRQHHPEYQWRTLGVAGGPWVDDPWPTICAADVIIAHAGQNSIADIAAAQKPAIIIAVVIASIIRKQQFLIGLSIGSSF